MISRNDPVFSASPRGDELPAERPGLAIRISLIDRSLYYKGLMLLIRKDREIHGEERGLMMRIGGMLGFESKFCRNAIDEVLDNKYIVDVPPYFENPRIALSFIRDGLKLSASDGMIHQAEIDWLESVAATNGISSSWAAEFNRFNSANGAGDPEDSLELKRFQWD